MTVVMSPAGELNALPSSMPTNGPGSDSHMISISSGSRSVELAEKDGVRQVVSLEQIYRTQPQIGALVNKLYRQISTLPLKAYSLNSQNEPQDVDREHGLATLLRAPVPRRGSVDLQEWISRGLFIHGNSLLAKWRGDGKDRPPTGLLPLRWPYVSAYAQLGGPVEWWGTTQVGDWKWLPVEESLHFAWGSDLGDIGVSPLEQLGVMLELDDASQRFQIASMKNGARPSGAISLPKEAQLTKEDRENMGAEIRRMHQGVDNSFRLALLTGGADWKPMSFSAVEAQLIEQRRVSREEACMIYDVPMQLVGDMSRGGLASVVEIHKMLYVTILRPWLAFIENKLTSQLIDAEPEWASEGLFLRFDLAEVLRGNSDQEITAAAQGFQNGLFTLNEARLRLNLPRVSVPEADMPHIPANNMAAISGGTPTGGPGPLAVSAPDHTPTP